MRVDAFKLPTDHPADVRGLQALLESGAVEAGELVCVLSKTEGNGGRNDFTPDLATRALEDLLAPRLGLPPDRVVLSLPGGTASVIGDACVHVSTRAEHHGPLGGGPLAFIARAA